MGLASLSKRFRLRRNRLLRPPAGDDQPKTKRGGGRRSRPLAWSWADRPPRAAVRHSPTTTQHRRRRCCVVVGEWRTARGRKAGGKAARFPPPFCPGLSYDIAKGDIVGQARAAGERNQSREAGEALPPLLPCFGCAPPRL